MKTLLSALFAAALAVSLPMSSVAQACDGKDDAKKDEKKAPAPAENIKTAANATFHVEGMHCEGCAGKVKAALAKTDGVIEVDIKLADHRVAVKYDKAKLSPDKIAKIISDLGYKASAEA